MHTFQPDPDIYISRYVYVQLAFSSARSSVITVAATGTGAAPLEHPLQAARGCRPGCHKKAMVSHILSALTLTIATQARTSGEFEQPFNEQKRRALQRALEHLLLTLPEAELPHAHAKHRPKSSAGAGAPAVRCACWNLPCSCC